VLLTISELVYIHEVREPAVAYGRNKFKEEEYLQMERSSVEKHEFYKGEIFDMSGARGHFPH
jgi:hypothetical protein